MRLPDNGTDNSSSIYPTLSHLGHALYKNNELKLAAESYLESFNIQASIVTGETIQDLDGFSKRISSIEDEILSLEQSGEDTSELSSALGGIANTLRYIALVNQAQGDSEKALNVNKLSLSVRLLQPFKEYSSIALMAETIAMFEFKLNNCARALDYFNQALTAKKAYQGDVTIDVARTVNNLANIHFSLGNLDEAMELYHEALEIKKSCLGEDSDDVVNTLKNIAQVMFKAGKEQEALQAYHNIVKIRQERYGKNHISVADTLASMGDVYIKLGELDVAKTYFEQSIKIQKSQEDGTFDERVLENLGSIYGKLGQWQKAESAFMELVQIKRTDHGSDFLGVARTLDLLAVSYIEQERSYESIEHLKEALRIRKVCLDADDDEVLASLNKLAFVYKSLDMTDEMQQMKAEFDAIQHGS
jgi:tetratricopeptide (TPR) repeat protein